MEEHHLMRFTLSASFIIAGADMLPLEDLSWYGPWVVGFALLIAGTVFLWDVNRDLEEQ